MLALSSQGHVLLQIGVALLLAICFEGFFVQKLRSPRMGLSVHTLATFEALLFLAFGLMWPTLKLTGLGASLAFWLFVYSAFATLVPYVLAAVWGAGGSTMSLAAGSARGSDLQESAIKVVLYSAAPTGIVAFALVFWGLRG
ncbi:MAG TPA: hypothetical protein VFE36_10685 [Candidatus Baltobacteraceae bacterium]|nr:hypothetical protein [Candidatus Baltobacteraceae bacterium]